jgi:hypothetical protein
MAAPQIGKLRAGLNWLFLSPFGQLLVLAAFALLMRASTFGHPAIHDDETFYFLVGQEMQKGALPYVDIWDRKPTGLFLIYYLIACISHSVLAYQLIATGFVVATALVIVLIAAETSSRWAGLLAGINYIALLMLFQGWGGQAPIFYNLPIAVSALLIIKAAPGLRTGTADWRVDLAMALCGLAIIIKQTTIVESAFFGLFCAWTLFRTTGDKVIVARAALRWMALGAAPMLAVSAFYFLRGHWAVYWHAMVVSNLSKQPATTSSLLFRAINDYLFLMPLLCVVVLALLLRSDGINVGKHRNFLVGWTIAAWGGFFIVPNLYFHYLLPVLVPLCIVSGQLFARRDIGTIFAAILLMTTLLRYNFLSFSYTQAAQQSMASLVRSIRTHDNGRDLFVPDGPLLLYSLSGKRPMSPLAFPLHLNYEYERNVSHINTRAEVARILAKRPGVIVTSAFPSNRPPNNATRMLVWDYIFKNCHLVDVQWSHEMGHTRALMVYGDC